MEQCWSGESYRRPLLGAIQPILESIQHKAERGKSLQQLNALMLEENSSPGQLNPALALAEPNNQRGAATNFPFKRKTFKMVKKPFCHTPRYFNTTVYPNMFIPMREF